MSSHEHDSSKYITRRAFALDSRTVWVEQQHVHSICLPKENLPLGPGEYSPKFPVERNISTPYIGKREIFKGGGYKPFNSSIWSEGIDGEGSSKRNRRGAAAGSPNGLNSLSGKRSDFVTIFHEHDERQPLDPKLRFCETVGPTLPHEPILDALKYDGRHKAPSIHLDKDNTRRFKEPKKLLEYDPNHNSQHIVRRSKVTFTPKVGHKNPFHAEDDYQPHVPKGEPMFERPEEMELSEWKPSIRTKTIAERNNLRFDASCYAKKDVPDIIRPSEINRLVKKDMFFRMLTTPVQYKTKEIGTSIDTRRFRGHY